jgi:hypothetical protein
LHAAAVKRNSRSLPPQAQCFGFALFCRQTPQVNDLKTRLVRRLHNLDWLPLNYLERGAPGFMTANHLGQAAPQRWHVERATAIDRHRFVVEILGELAM